MIVVAGIGFRGRATTADIVDIVHRAQNQTRSAVRLLAVPQVKAGPAALAEALAEAVAILELPLITLDRMQLERVQGSCPTQSAAAMTAIGLGSVAEACALAALDEHARLVLPRIANTQATCALAMGNRL